MVECSERTGDRALLFDESSGSSAPQSFGAYRVLHQIGSGVLGPVFRSYDPQRDRLIAVKAFKLDIVPEDAERLTEALQPLCEGPAPDRTLVRLLETGLSGSTAFVAMEFATGESLDVALRHLAPVSLERALPMLDALATAIDTAWAGGIGHGALHPRDVIVAPGTMDVRVTGFGIGPALESIGLTPPARRPYSAPERAAGEAWDIRADVYSLGAIAHELLTGRKPVGSGEPEEATPLHRVLATALATDPADRFASARLFIDALEEVAQTSLEPAEEPLPLAVAAPPTLAFEPEPNLEPEPDLAPEPELDPALDPEPALAFELQPEPRAEVDVAEVPIAAPPGLLNPPEPEPAPRLYKYPWVALAVVGIAGVVLGSVGTYLAVGNRSAAPSLGSAGGAVSPSESTQARAETEVQVAGPPTATTPVPTPPVSEPAPPPPPPKVEPPVRAAATPGRLVIRSEPAGARVTLDGRRVGETPLTLRDLPLGPHAVQVARPGYSPETRRVTLSTRTPSLTVSVALRQGASPSPGAKSAARTGSIYADSKPRGARVSIDGRAYGSTPLLVPELGPGTHTVRFELDGHAPSTSTVTVKAGEQARVSASLVRR